MEEWDLPFAYEALARAHGVAGNAGESAQHAERAGELADRIADAEDRELVLSELRGL
jgi:hypothetical protein